MLTAQITHDFRLPMSIGILCLAFVFATIKLLAKRSPRKKQEVEPALDDQTATWLVETLERDRIEQSARRKRAAVSAEYQSSKHRPRGETDSLLD
jgi:hypothetical protein